MHVCVHNTCMLFPLLLQVKNRSRRLTHLFQSYETYSCLVGSHTKVLVTELSHDGNYYVGHTKAYEQVRRLPYIVICITMITKLKIPNVYLFKHVLDVIVNNNCYVMTLFFKHIPIACGILR